MPLLYWIATILMILDAIAFGYLVWPMAHEPKAPKRRATDTED